jgi:hypothetical protein
MLLLLHAERPRALTAWLVLVLLILLLAQVLLLLL